MELPDPPTDLFVANNPMWSGGSPHNVEYVWYWIGTWKAATRTFVPDSTVPKLFDHGEHFTGPSGFVDEQGRSIIFGIASLVALTDQSDQQLSGVRGDTLHIQLEMSASTASR
ncbi:hypothetical protein ACFQQB_57505 [Nonomuraea rubra]